jgi:hypothetical protein
MAYGLFASYFAASMAWGGIFYGPVIVPIVVFSVTLGTVLLGLALTAFGLCKCCRRCWSRWPSAGSSAPSA